MTEVVAGGLSARELAGLDPIGGRSPTEERAEQEAVSSAEYMAHLEETAVALGLRIDKDAMLAEAIKEGLVKLSDEERLARAIAAELRRSGVLR